MRYVLVVLSLLLIAACGQAEEFGAQPAIPAALATASASGPGSVARHTPTFDPVTASTATAAAVTATANANATTTVLTLLAPRYYIPAMPTPGPSSELPAPVAPAVMPSSRSWGGYGAASGQFDRPHGVAVDASGRVFVADTQNQRVQIFSSEGSLHGELGGGPGDEPGQFTSPTDVCVDPTGHIYVVDNNPGRVQKFDPSGALLLAFGSDENASSDPAGSGDSAVLTAPLTVACSIPGTVFVADAGSWRIVRYSAEGVFETAWSPNDVTVAPVVAVSTTPDGRVLVSDLTNARVSIYDVEGNSLGVLIDAAAAGSAVFIPWSIETAPDGTVYVSDIRNQRLLKLAPDGTLASEVRLSELGQAKFFVHGLAVTPEGVLVVTQSTLLYDGGTWLELDFNAPDRIDQVAMLTGWQ